MHREIESMVLATLGFPRRVRMALMATILLAALMALALAARPAFAATFVVDRNDDPETGGGACTAAPNDCSLRGAISKANTTTGRDAVNLPADTYTLELVNDPAILDENANATGDLDITEQVDIVGLGRAPPPWTPRS